MCNKKNILSIIILLCFFGLLEVKSDESASDILSQLNIDVKKINPHKWKSAIREKYIDNYEDDESEIFKLQWSGNGDFGKKYPDKLLWKGKKINVINPEINFNNNYEGEATEESEELSSTPSRVLEPPFNYYSSSIHDLTTEMIETFPTTTTTTESYEKESKNNTFHIYEITSTKSSSPNKQINDAEKIRDENPERSFIIDEINNELKSSDSLRSVILNRQQINNNQDDNNNYDKEIINDDYKSREINRENVIRPNRLSIKNDRTSKSYYWNRGNRKYQKAVSNDETISVRDKTWSYPTDDRFEWKKIRQINRGNNYRRFGIISRVYNLRSDERDRRVGPVPGVPGRDYPIHQEHTHHHLQNTAARFLCPTNSNSHIYLADRASRCQIFYVCFNGDIGVPMMCPNGTLFSQELQVCDWWYNVKC